MHTPVMHDDEEHRILWQPVFVLITRAVLLKHLGTISK